MTWPGDLIEVDGTVMWVGGRIYVIIILFRYVVNIYISYVNYTNINNVWWSDVRDGLHYPIFFNRVAVVKAWFILCCSLLLINSKFNFDFISSLLSRYTL